MFFIENFNLLICLGICCYSGKFKNYEICVLVIFERNLIYIWNILVIFFSKIYNFFYDVFDM